MIPPSDAALKKGVAVLSTHPTYLNSKTLRLDSSGPKNISTATNYASRGEVMERNEFTTKMNTLTWISNGMLMDVSYNYDTSTIQLPLDTHL